MSAIELTYFITTVSNLIAEEKTAEELSILSAMFVQLADTLATLALFAESDIEIKNGNR
ncbi:MAG: DUF6774 domain-containing protein [Anaerovorax sp.]|nr:DUF6774 domain-containing protein [Anaerovorax sp.]